MSTPQFIHAIKTTLRFWQQETELVSDHQLLALTRDSKIIFRVVATGLSFDQTWEATIPLMLQLLRFIERFSYWREWTPLLSQAIDRCHPTHPGWACLLLNQKGYLCLLQNQLSEALALHQEAERLANSLDDPFYLAHSQASLGRVYLRLRQYEQAAAFATAALQRYQQLEVGSYRIAATLDDLGLTAMNQGHKAEAEVWFRQALALWRDSDHHIDLARALNNLALLHINNKRVTEGLHLLEEAAQLLSNSTFQHDHSKTFINKGLAHWRLEQLELAEAAFRQAYTPALKQTGDLFHYLLVTLNLGVVLTRLNRLEEAMLYLQEALLVGERYGDEVLLGNVLSSTADVWVARQNYKAAQPYLERAVALLSKYPDDEQAKRWLPDVRDLQQQVQQWLAVAEEEE